MPLDPRTWTAKDYVTASRLNADLNSYQALQFVPNGVRFHSRHPLYKSSQSNPGTIPASSWISLFGPQGSTVTIDSSGDYGAHMDPEFQGMIADALPFSNGNPALINGASGRPIGGGGGWYLCTAFVPASIQGTGFSRANIASGFQNGNPNLVSTGTVQNGNGAHDTCCFVVDLINFDGGTYQPVVYNGGTPAPLAANADGSGETGKWTAQWASIYPQYGFNPSAGPAPLASWANNTVVNAALLNGNTGIRDVLRFLNTPPALRVTATSSTSCTSGTSTTVALGTAQLDTWGGWNNGTDTYTVPVSGAYLVYGAVAWMTPGSGNTVARAGISLNGGAASFGPRSSLGAGNDLITAKMHILDLHAGDTITLQGQQNTGSTLGTATGTGSVLVMLWLGALGTPSPLPSNPDLSYRYPAGNAGSVNAATLNAHLANDLNLLTFKPYLLSKQTTAQNVAQSTDTALLMDTITGNSHSTAGDNYSGWDATNKRYVAQVPGWYLCVQETFFGTPSLTVNPSTLAEFQVSTNQNAVNPWDWYQHMNLTATNPPGGAAAIGYYYLRAGDWITPGCQTQDTASGTLATNVGGPNSHFECIWVSE